MANKKKGKAQRKKPKCKSGKSFACGFSCQPIFTKSGKAVLCRSNLNKSGNQVVENYVEFLLRSGAENTENRPKKDMVPPKRTSEEITSFVEDSVEIDNEIRDSKRSKEFLAALSLYTSDGGYQAVKKKTVSDQTLKALEDLPYKNYDKAFRGLSFDDPEKAVEFIRNIENSSELEQKNIASFSYRPEVAASFAKIDNDRMSSIIMEIENIKGVNISQQSEFFSESEILTKGGQSYILESIDRYQDGPTGSKNYYIKLKQI